MRATMPLILLGLVLMAACSGPEEPSLKEFYGTWKVDFQRSWDLAILTQDSPSKEDSLGVTDYMSTMADIMEMSIDDYYLTYTRGRHVRQVPYELSATRGDSVIVGIEVDGTEYELAFSWAEEGYMFIESSATPGPDHFVYFRASEETADLIPPISGTPGAP